MSILCHIWKIVPDLYEAITRITHTENETSNFTHLQNCSVREPVNDVSDIYFINRNYVGVRIYQGIRMIKRSEMRPLRGATFWNNHLPAVTTILTPILVCLKPKILPITLSGDATFCDNHLHAYVVA